MNENNHYIIIIVAAIVLMATGLYISYKWQQSKHVTRSSAMLVLDPKEYGSLNPTSPNLNEADSLQQTDEPSVDSTAIKKQQMLATMKAIRQSAEREGYLWQQQLRLHRFREPALACLEKMEQHGTQTRDSLQTLYVEQVPNDSVVRWFDKELKEWQTRLQEQVEMLPTAEQAYDAEQISEDEYRKILKSLK